jgi:deferrochelatase/peroxidase EfeB
VNLAETWINHRAPQYRKLLQNLQGNILKGHGRNHALYLGLQFTAEPQAVATWMRDFASTYVTSAQRQLDDSALHKRQKDHHCMFSNLLLSAGRV